MPFSAGTKVGPYPFLAPTGAGRMGRWWVAVILYGLLNSIAYSCLLPLWEGWDEGYHYGYVQYLSIHWRFPVLGRTDLSREIWRSYELTPVSHYLQGFTKAPLNFSDYLRLSESERQRLRLDLRSIPVAWGREPQDGKWDYEAIQSPLPYLLMAVVDRALAEMPLPDRVLWLRIVFSTIGVVLLANAVWLLSRELSLEGTYAVVALFCIFSSQVLYAVFCHVCNDCLAVPAGCYLIFATIRAWRHSSTGTWAIAGTITAAALLAKAYLLFMATLPVAVLVGALWRRRAGIRASAAFVLPLAVLAAPWYVRNLVLYRNLTGTADSTSNLSLRLLVDGAKALPWRDGIAYMAHGSLWTGNNSFTTFSASTLNVLLATLTAGVVLYLARAERRMAEWATVAAVGLHCAGLSLIGVAYFVSTKGALIGAWPWYSQVLLVPLFLIVLLGFSRFDPLGRFGLVVCPLLWGYVMTCTYFVKLIPQYGGFTGNAHFSSLWHWYLGSARERDSLLETTCIASPAVVWPILGAILLLQTVICGKFLRSSVRAFHRRQFATKT